jgi:hypothetical protein
MYCHTIILQQGINQAGFLSSIPQSLNYFFTYSDPLDQTLSMSASPDSLMTLKPILEDSNTGYDIPTYHNNA